MRSLPGTGSPFGIEAKMQDLFETVEDGIAAVMRGCWSKAVGTLYDKLQL